MCILMWMAYVIYVELCVPVCADRISEFYRRECLYNIPYGKVTCFPHANNAWNTCDLHVCLNKNCTLFPHV